VQALKDYGAQATIRRFFPYLIFTISILLSVLLGSSLTALHTPFRAERAGAARLAAELASGRCWRAVHVLSASCQCSSGVAEHLLARGPIPDLREEVLLAGDDKELIARLSRAGFRTLTVTGDQLAQKYGIAGAPWLLLISPTGEIAYQGGYASDAGARTGYQDARIWMQVRQGKSPEALPVFGCALGKRLQRTLDPLALKYSRN
jgi:hypothetical protein